MKVFRDLIISATTQQMAGVVAEIEKTMPPGWERDKAAEARSRSTPVLTPRVMYCFGYKMANPKDSAMVILSEKKDGTFYVSNIIPIQRHRLVHAEYNAIVEEFYFKVIKPIVERAGLMCTLTSTEEGPENWLAPEAADRLREFSASADRGTGSSHPNDRERWNAFVLVAHRTESKLDASTLMRWLVESEDWPREIAEQLALEYEYGRELLEFEASHQVA
jgi:hypothetical protein